MDNTLSHKKEIKILEKIADINIFTANHIDCDVHLTLLSKNVIKKAKT